jgi:Sigma-70, region 4
MSREHREIIDLFYYHEKSVEEVADIIHMPRNTVKTRMFYARKRLARLLSTHRDFLITSWRPRRHDPPAARAREHRSPLAPRIPTGPWGRGLLGSSVASSSFVVAIGLFEIAFGEVPESVRGR